MKAGNLKMSNFTFDKKGFIIDGKRQFLISGEIQYFRVPKKDWEKRIKLLVETGANSVATYVPWCVHEPTEGNILFGDCEERDLAGFLDLARRYNLKVTLRPGPYEYSELIADGIPMWLYENYPETHALQIDGSEFNSKIPVFSYLSPIFLEKTKRYFKVFCNVIKPYLAQNGGPVAMIQLDNELMGVHIWRGSLDYNPVSMGIGKANGRYPRFLQNKYQNISSLNVAYGTDYASFEAVQPISNSPDKKQQLLIRQDYFSFYCETVCEFANILQDYLHEFGVHEYTCHNAASPGFVPLFDGFNQRLGKDFLLTLDSYYILTYSSGQLAPTPKYLAENIMFGADMLEEMGNPYSVFEMQAGSFTNIPPLLPEPLEAFYMSHLAMGLKGVNYYIFTGGKNSGEYGMTNNVYDYSACVSANGKKRPNYNVIKRFSQLMKQNAWLSETSRDYSVRIGLEAQTMCADQNAGHPDAGYRSRLVLCLVYTLMMTKYAGKYSELSKPIPTDKPLLIYATHTMSRQAQQNVVDFVQNGGKLILIGGVATLDENGEPCTVLADLVNIKTATNESRSPITKYGEKELYCLNFPKIITDYQTGDTPFLSDGDTESVLGIRGKRGLGEIIYIGGTWRTELNTQAELLADLLDSINAQPILSCSNQSINYSIRRGKDKTAVFLMNLHNGKQSTNVTLYDNGIPHDLGKFTLKPVEVKMLVYNNNKL